MNKTIMFAPVTSLIHQNQSTLFIASKNCLNQGTCDTASKVSLLGITAVAGEWKAVGQKGKSIFCCCRTHSEWCIAVEAQRTIGIYWDEKNSDMSWSFSTILCQLPPVTACTVNNCTFSCSHNRRTYSTVSISCVFITYGIKLGFLTSALPFNGNLGWLS